MSKPAEVAPKQVVIVYGLGGSPLVYFETDRTVFPEIATYERDRILRLVYEGGLIPTSAGWESSPSSALRGAVYQQVEDCWRMSTKTIDEAKPRQAARRSATIIPFPHRSSLAEGPAE